MVNGDNKFVRYADDCNIYVKSRRAGRRVMESVKKFAVVWGEGVSRPLLPDLFYFLRLCQMFLQPVSLIRRMQRVPMATAIKPYMKVLW